MGKPFVILPGFCIIFPSVVQSTYLDIPKGEMHLKPTYQLAVQLIVRLFYCAIVPLCSARLPQPCQRLFGSVLRLGSGAPPPCVVSLRFERILSCAVTVAAILFPSLLLGHLLHILYCPGH